MNKSVTKNDYDKPKPQAPAEPKRLKALVVDDDFACRLILQGLLSKYGDCHIAVNGAEAIKAFKVSLQTGEPYDLICMDIEMPDMDGTEAVTQIRALEQQNNDLNRLDAPEVRILMTTSLQDVKTMFQSFGAKCDDYLTKPVDGRKLEKYLMTLGLIAA